jgi:predicted nucleic acid-binding protein
MGLILDSTVLIAAERKGQTAREALTQIGSFTGGEAVAISIITIVELMHGVVRANTAQRRATRRQFLDEVMLAIPIHPVSIAVALRAGQIDGENSAKGLHLAMSDLLIGVIALELGYRVATANERHFRMVPGLDIAIF